MELVRLFVNMSSSFGGGNSFFNIGLAPLLLFLLSLRLTGDAVIRSKGPFRDQTVSLMVKLIIYMTAAVFGAVAAFVASMEIFAAYPQFFAMEALFQIEDSTIRFLGYGLFNETLALCAVYALVLFVHSRVVIKSVPQSYGADFAGGKRMWKLTAWPDLLLLGFLLVFCLMMRAPSLLYRLTLNFETANLLYGLYFEIIVLLLIRAVILLVSALLMAPGCRKEQEEKTFQGHSPVDRFTARARRQMKGKLVLGVICIFLVAFVLMVLSDEAWVNPGEDAVNGGISRYSGKLLRFEDVNIVYSKQGYLSTAQGEAVEDLYIGEVAAGVYLAIYVDTANQRSLEMGNGNLVIGQVQGYRSGPEKKFSEVAAEMGIDVRSAVLLAHPLKYKLPRGVYFTRGLCLALVLMPVWVMATAALGFVNPLGGRSFRKFKETHGDWERLIAQLELELEDEKKIFYKGSAFSQGCYVTENFYFMESLGGPQVVPLRDILAVEQIIDGRYNSSVVTLMMKNGEKRKLSTQQDVAEALRQRLKAIQKS